MINAKASFDKASGNIKFEKLKWKVPVMSLVKLQLRQAKEKVDVIIFTDLEK